MSPTADAFLRSWPFAPWLTASLIGSALLYLRGWNALHSRDPQRWHAGQPSAFLGGLASVFLALGSPIEPFAPLLLQVHMIQHMLLMMVAPPLLWLGEPLFPMIRGVPGPVRTYWVAPLLRSRVVARVAAWLARPPLALAVFIATTWVWHAPLVYEAAVRDSILHRLQHLCFFGSALVFWFNVVRPYPFRPRWSVWLLVPYLLAADVSNTVLSALLTFSDRVLYPHYTQIPRLGGISALDDQSTAGVIMWVPGSVAFLLPLFGIGLRQLFGRNEPGREESRRPAARHPVLNPAWDLLRLPALGRFLRWRFGRRILQGFAAVLALVVIVDGLSGIQVSAMNLAGVLPWIHWRGFVILGLLAVGNLSCMACPFTLPRTFARRWFPARLDWPRKLRSKWLAVSLVALYLWSYEVFSLWDSPRATAWIVIGYFAAAFAVDSLFRGASFCKYVCPIGQFNYVQSVVSPMEVKVLDTMVCHDCRTRECIRGTAIGLNGCELELSLPQKTGNLDCTFCLDCAHVCPHDNVGILAVPPGRDMGNGSRRSGIGRLRDRPDLSALVLVVVFGAFANAGGMVAPVQDWQDSMAHRFGLTSPLAVTTAGYLAALVAAPLLAFGLTTLVSERWTPGGSNRWESATRFSHSLIPIGFAMWLSHYGYHLLTSWRSAIPATQRFAARLGWPHLGTPEWTHACCRPVGDWLPRLEIVCLDLGLLLSLYCAFRIAGGRTPTAWRAFSAWSLVIVLLFATGVWIVLQPMQMRGMLASAR